MSGCVCVKGKRRGYFPLCSDSRVGEGGVGVGGMVFVSKCRCACVSSVYSCVCVCVCQGKEAWPPAPVCTHFSV